MSAPQQLLSVDTLAVEAPADAVRPSSDEPWVPAASSAEMLDLILAATNDGIMDWDLVTGAIRYSPRWKTMLGFEDADRLDETASLWRDLTHPQDLPAVEALLREHIENVWPFAHKWRMRHKDGGWRWLMCRAVTLLDELGAPRRCVGIFTDVTEQVLIEHNLSEVTRRTELLLTSAGEGFLGIDETGIVAFANPAATQCLGVAMVDLVGKNLANAFVHGCPAGEACTPASCPILMPFVDGGIHRVPNATFGRKDGSSFTVDYVTTPAREESRVVSVVLTFRDVTEQRRVESQLLQGQKLEAIGQLAAGIAHEINTPMQYIGDNVCFLDTSFTDLLNLVSEYRSILDVMNESAPNPELGERAAAAEEAADLGFLIESIPTAMAATKDGIDRVRKIVYAMKEFSHPGSAEKAPTNLNRAIETTVTISANIWKQTATLDLALDPELPSVSCQVGEVNQVILNLIVNASHAIADFRKNAADDPLGVIRIETGVNGDFAEIRISDTGGGIPDHVRHRIFEPFFTTKEVGRGTGQGLTLARSMIVDKHAGRLSFTTEVGKGTTFTIGLPLHTDSVEPIENP